MPQHKILYTLRALAVFFLAAPALFGLPALAETAQNTTAAPSINILPASSATLGQEFKTFNEEAQTHPPLRITPDKSELIRLKTEAATIIVGNPTHLKILADSTKTLILVPQIPGATHFIVLDKNSDIIMQRHVIVAAPKEKYVRIRRSCASAGDNCQETSVYYCPDMCHEVSLVTKPSTATGGGSAQANGSATDANGNAGAQNDAEPESTTPPSADP